MHLNSELLFKKLEENKIAISGSNGVIGSQLAKRLGKTNALDRTGNLTAHYDIIYDLGAYGNLASHYIGDERKVAKEIYKANLFRVIELISNLRGDEKYIYISTSSVGVPVKTAYSLSKQAAEEYIRHVQSKAKMKMCIVRPFTAIGIGEQEEHLIPRLIDSCLNGTRIPFIGHPVHDFVSYDDLVDALILLKDMGNFNGEIYEVGTGISTSNEEIKEIVERITGKKANIERVRKLRDYDTEKWSANLEKIMKLGWKPKKSPRDIIREMVYAKQNTTNF